MGSGIEEQLRAALRSQGAAVDAAEKAFADGDFPRCKRALGNAGQAVALTKQSLRRADLSMGGLSGPEQITARRACDACRECISMDEQRMRDVKSGLDRQDLFGSAAQASVGADAAGQGGAAAGSTSDASDYLRTSVQSHERSSGALQHSQQAMAETEAIHLGVLDDLGNQRETLLRANERVNETSSAAQQARHALRRMAWRTLYNRALLWAIIFILVTLIGLVVFVRFLK